jgi:hypothetical protein
MRFSLLPEAFNGNVRSAVLFKERTSSHYKPAWRRAGSLSANQRLTKLSEALCGLMI